MVGSRSRRKILQFPGGKSEKRELDRSQATPRSPMHRASKQCPKPGYKALADSSVSMCVVGDLKQRLCDRKDVEVATLFLCAPESFRTWTPPLKRTVHCVSLVKHRNSRPLAQPPSRVDLPCLWNIIFSRAVYLCVKALSSS